MFWELLFAVTIGGLLVVSVLGYCGVIFWKWAIRELMEIMEEAYQIYYNKLDTTFTIKEEK